MRRFHFVIQCTHIYVSSIITRLLPSGTPLLYWEAALSVLQVAHLTGNNPARQAAIEGLKSIFPYSLEPVPFKPAIAGLRTKDEETNFYRTFPLQAIPILRLCDMEAMLPMAFYHAAQLTAEDLNDGVRVGDQVYKLDAEDARIALMGHETLKNARNQTLLQWIPEILRHQGPRKASPRCADMNLRGGLSCYEFLVRLQEQTTKPPHNVATHSLQTFSEPAKELIQENLCFECLERVLQCSDEYLAITWKGLPGCFGLPPWEILIKHQNSNEEAWGGNCN